MQQQLLLPGMQTGLLQDLLLLLLLLLLGLLQFLGWL
jgi:hypothetical protein